MDASHRPDAVRPARPARPLRVGVLAEPELVVHGVRAMLDPYGERALLAGAAPDPHAVPSGVDVVLCDPFPVPPAPRGPGLDGLRALAPARVLVFSWHTHPVGVRAALRAGAAGYLAKTASGAELVAALEAVVRGELPVPAPCTGAGTDGSVDGSVDGKVGAGAGSGFPGLSTREAEVLALICRGLSNQEIADHLFVSINSVKTYIRQVYAKTGVTRRTQAVAWAHGHGWVG